MKIQAASVVRKPERNIMNRILMVNAAALCILFSCPNLGSAQTMKDLAGTWTLVSNVNTRPDGGKVDLFGPHDTGLAIFGGDGHFIIMNINPDTPKFASDNIRQGTPDENKAAVAGGIGLYGTYSISGNVIDLNVEGSTYPNWTGTQQKRTVIAFSANESKWTFPAAAGGTNEVTWRRAK
jgi:hypothetical protein